MTASPSGGRPRGAALLHRFAVLLLALGFGVGAVVDPLTLASGTGSGPGRWLQGLCLATAFLHLCAAEILGGAGKPEARQAVPWLVAGTLLTLAGIVLSAATREMALFVAAGAGVHLWGLRSLFLACPDRTTAALLGVVAFGVLLDLGAGAAASGLFSGMESWLGADDGLRLRLLRLARAASATLPVLVLLYEGVAAGSGRWPSVGRWALLGGAVGMPLVLTAAAVQPVLKYGLPLPADALVVGVAVAAVLAWRGAGPLEASGWTLVLASMGVGLLVGLFAFDGPLPSLSAIGGYSHFPRVLLRVGHAYAVVLGVALILASRGEPGRWGLLLAAGSAVTLVGLAAPLLGGPYAALAVGPALVCLSLVLWVPPRSRAGLQKAGPGTFGVR